ncbi:MAG: AMP-binding protein [bacterium]|nr:AMP-binding protein [bacterium]
MAPTGPPDARWTLGSALREAADQRGDLPLFSFFNDDAVATVADVERATGRVSAGLVSLGLAAGDNVLIMLGNEAPFTHCWWGANRLGTVEVPVNTSYHGYFLEHLVNTSGADLMIVRDELVPAVVASAAEMPQLKRLVVVGDHDQVDGGRFEVIPFEVLTEDRPAVDAVVGPADTCSINFTSGTTGPSKGAMMPHAYHFLMASRVAQLLRFEPGEVYLMPLPLYHMHAQTVTYAALLGGAHVHYQERFSTTNWLEVIREVGATCTISLGVILSFILKQPERPDDADNPLQRLWSCPTPPVQIAEFQRRFDVPHIVTSYGSTEIGMITMADYDESRPASVGKVSEEFYDVVLLDEEDNPVPIGEQGELCVRPRIPSILLKGYYDRPDLTLEAMRNLWFHSGDVMSRDAEGYYCFIDRKHDRLRRRGHNIASMDLEEVFFQHDGVVDVAVVAVPSDFEGGEDELKACIALAEGTAADPDAIWDWAERRLPAFAVPRYLEFMEVLPKTPTEKVRKFKLRASGVAGCFDRERHRIPEVE